MAKYKLTWKDLSWNDFKVYLFALFKAFLPKKKLAILDDLEILFNQISLGNSSNTLWISKN